MRQYLFNDFARKGLVGRDVSDETFGFKPVEFSHSQGREVRFVRPRGPELGTGRCQYENREMRDTFDRERQQLKRTWVDPMNLPRS